MYEDATTVKHVTTDPPRRPRLSRERVLDAAVAIADERGLAALTEPVLGPIRRSLPQMGGLDISPIVALIGLQFLQYLVVYYAPRLMG